MSELELLTEGWGLIEAPRVDENDRLYFSDVPNGGVYRRLPSGEIETVIPKRRGVGGMVFHRDGGLVVGGRNIQHVNDGQIRVLFDPGFPGFNDLHTDSLGRVYVGSLKVDPFEEGVENPGGELWRLDAGGQATELYDGVLLTNGIGFSPDGSLLYHADSVPGRVWVSAGRFKGMHRMVWQIGLSLFRIRWSPACVSVEPILRICMLLLEARARWGAVSIEREWTFQESQFRKRLSEFL